MFDFKPIEKMQAEESIILSPYLKQELKWPQKGNVILAQHDQQSVIIYQAFKPAIAEAVIKHQCYHHQECLAKGFSLTRMTWIKTNFLWMMHRSGWGTKHNQQRILAIKISKKGFEQILLHAYHGIMKTKHFAQKVRLQWDPSYNPNDQVVKSGRRAIQLGIPPGLFTRLSKQMILKIQDITNIVIAGREKLSKNGKIQQLIIPYETAYQIENKQIRAVVMKGEM